MYFFLGFDMFLLVKNSYILLQEELDSSIWHQLAARGLGAVLEASPAWAARGLRRQQTTALGTATHRGIGLSK